MAKHIAVGVTGSIAAYKACELVRLLVKAGHQVRCCLTDAGSRFITPLTLATLTGEPCFGANPEYHAWRPNPKVEHVDLARWADVVAVVRVRSPAVSSTVRGSDCQVDGRVVSLSTRSIPVGTAYAVWVGIGAVGTAAYGMLWLGEDRSVARMACFGLILMGIVGLKLLTLRSDTGA